MKTNKLLIFTLLPLLVGCGGNQPSSSEPLPSSSENPIVTITDAQGREVSYDKTKLNRVICLAAGALRFYSYVCDLDKLIGVEQIDTANTFGPGQALRPYYLANKDRFDALPVISKGGPDRTTATNPELIIAAKPDIVISFLSADENNALQEQIKKPIIGLKQGNAGVFDPVTLNSFKLLGDIFGKQDRVTELTNYINSCKADFEELSMSEDTYYAGGIGNWGKTDMLGTIKSFPVFNVAKAKGVMGDMELLNDKGEVVTNGQGKIDLEKLQASNPDHIFFDTAAYNNFKADYNKPGNEEKYTNLKAFKNGEVYQVIPYNAYYTNLEVQLMSTYYVASIAHEDFEVDLEAKYNEITKKFLGKEMYNDIKANNYGLGGYQKLDLGALKN